MAQHDVEEPVGKRKILGAPLTPVDLHVWWGGGSGDVQHAGVDVDGNHVTVSAHVLCRQPRHHTGPTGNIQHPLPGAEIGDL